VTAPLTVRPSDTELTAPRLGSTRSTLATLVRHELRRAARSWVPRAVFAIIPLWLAWFVKPAFGYALVATGTTSAAAASQALAGQAVMFGSISLIFLGHAIFEDRDTQSDERLRSGGVSRWELIVSKLIVTLVHEALLTAFVLVIGSLALGATSPGDIAGWVALSAAWCLAATAIGLVLVGLSRTAAGFTLVCYGGSLVLVAGAGGLAPYTLLPHWARTLSRVFPSHWFLRGVDDLVVRRRVLADVAPDVGALVACAMVGFVVGALLLRYRRPSTEH
jgi:ABC-type multidrug transport system permease subunit